MNVNRLIENLKKYANPRTKRMPMAERATLQRRVMKELTGKNYNKIKSWMDSAEGKNLSFDYLFDGQKRVIVPWAKKSKADGTIGDIIEFFENNGWTVDLSTGTVSRTKEIEIPKGPRKGEKVSKTETQRIGKIFRTVYQYDDKPTAAAGEAVEKLLPNFDPDRGSNMVRALEYDEFWSSKAEYYRQNPDAVNRSDSQYSIIVSRHPIDVLRMSDFEDIKSCHSEGGGYFQCAMAEAKGHGPIAYLVNTADLEEIDLDDEEVFEDPARRVEGIRPIARLRLRKYANKDGEWELAAPEDRVYGRRVPGFKEEVLKWAKENQKHVDYQDVLADYGNSKIKRYGGSYADTPDWNILNNFFEGPYDFVPGNYVEHSDEGDDEDLFDQYEEQCNEIMTYARDLEHVYVDYSIEDVGDGEPYVIMSGGVYFNLSDELEDVEISNREVYRIIQQASDDTHVYLPDPDFSDWQEDNLTYIAYIGNEDEPPTPNGFEDFVRYMEDIDRAYDEIMENVREILVEKGIVTTTGLPSAQAAVFQQKLASLSKFAAKVNGNKFLIVTKNPIVLDNKIDKWKKIDKDILAAFRKEFEQHVKKAILKTFLEQAHEKQDWDAKAESDGEPIEEHYSLSFDLEGVTFNFLSRYEVTSHKNIKPMVAYFEDIDKKYSFLEQIVRQTYTGMVDKYKEEIAGQMRLPGIEPKTKDDSQADDIMNQLGMAAESGKKPTHKKIFENWRKYLG